MKHIHLYEHFIELNEAKVRLDVLANQLISATFKKWTTDFKSGKSESSFFDQIEMTGLEFDLDANIRFNSKGFDILDSTGADARDYDEDEDDEDDEDFDAESIREKLIEDAAEEIYDALEDPVQYFVHDQGMYKIGDLMQANFIMIDYD